jgi:gas vesicle protein
MKTSTESGITYLVIGLGLGLMAGLLWAPRLGEEMREELRRGANSGLDYVTEEADRLRAEGNRWFGRIKERFHTSAG